MTNHSAQPIGMFYPQTCVAKCRKVRIYARAHLMVAAARLGSLCARRGNRRPHQKACGVVAMYEVQVARGGYVAARHLRLPP